MICPVCACKEAEFYVEKNSHKVYKCPECDVLFVWPTPGNLNAVYSERYFKTDADAKVFGYIDYEKDKESTKGTFTVYLKIIENYRRPGKIFDVGAATGYFLDIAKSRNWDTAGIDISEYASSVSAQKGHKAFAGLLKDMDVGDGYDAVTMWDVFEHVEDPQEYMKKTNRILNMGGICAVNTIDKNSLWAKSMGKRWHLIIPPEHIFFYSKNSLKKLFEDNGFEILEIKKIGKKFGLPYIFKMLYHWQHFSLWNSVYKYCAQREKLRNFSVPINLRDNIFIIARKIKDV